MVMLFGANIWELSVKVLVTADKLNTFFSELFDDGVLRPDSRLLPGLIFSKWLAVLVDRRDFYVFF